ncbi:NB-ARC domain-containing protein [Okeanomitos corallinicola TIOX110]|uniref:NB-ARC domain-containing protein n=1 Tax=Okeanomitos corallinicola TIOX110 TaxID=3133117 RepID=A0ABZ2ULF1_9CYAN
MIKVLLNLQTTPNSLNVYNINGNNNSFYHPKISYQPNKQYQETDINTQSKPTYHNLSLAPKIHGFYGRKKDLEFLSNWISNQKTSLISVLGLSGIGKTTLVKKFVDLHLDEFEVIIWRSLKFPKSLNLLIDDLLNVCEEKAKQNIDDKLKQLFDIFKDKKCLIILDDLENIFIHPQYAGQYQPEYQNYQTFLKMITEIEHQSCVIIISQEKCQEMISLDDELYPSHCLELSGLGDAVIEILKNQELQNQEVWLELINLYESNPRYLQYISTLIKDIFQGETSEFIQENCLILTEDMKTQLDLTWNKLTNVEKQILSKIAQHDQPLSRDEIKNSLSLSSIDIINGLQSLTRRYLLTKSENNEKLFHLSPVFREFLKNIS